MAPENDSQGAALRAQDSSAAPSASGLKGQFLWSMAPLLAVTALNFFSVPLFLRYLGDEMYALWFYVITFTGMFGFADMGLGVATSRYVGMALGKGDQRAVHEYWGTGNLIVLPLLGLAGILFAVLGYFWGPVWFNVAPANRNLLRLCFLLGGVSLFVNYYAQVWVFLLQAHLEFKFTNLLRTIFSLVQVLGAIGIAVLTRNPAWICAWTAVVGLVQLTLLVEHSRRRYGVHLELKSARRERAQEMALFTGKVFTSLLAGSLFGSMDRMILGKLAPAIDFAHYTIAGNVGMRLQGLGTAVIGPIFHNTNRAVGGAEHASPARIYNEMFHFMFPWYLLAAVWLSLWHPVLLRAWLGQERATTVGPLFVPMIVAFCLMALANISTSQLSALNRVGTTITFLTVAGLLAAAAVYLGWHFFGVTGVAYGFLASRLAFVLQDVYTIRLVKAGGWFSPETWTQIGIQCLIAVAFAATFLVLPRNSLWLLCPAMLHAAVVALWLLRHSFRRSRQY
jgi:O-antigen/teichoic acid export membrane protein